MKETIQLYIQLTQYLKLLAVDVESATRQLPAAKADRYRVPNGNTKEFRKFWVRMVSEQSSFVGYLLWRFSASVYVKEKAEIRAQLERVQHRKAA